jgi:hypothetical protein
MHDFVFRHRELLADLVAYCHGLFGIWMTMIIPFALHYAILRWRGVNRTWRQGMFFKRIVLLWWI